MLHQSWQNQSWIKFLQRYLIYFSLLSNIVIAQDDILGPIQSLEKQISQQRDEYKTLVHKLLKSGPPESNFNTNEKISISSVYIESIIANSEEQFLRLSKTKCDFYALLYNNLLKTTFVSDQNILLNKNGNFILGDKQKFLEAVIKKDCFKLSEILTLFSVKNNTSTVKSLKFIVPENQKQCSNQFNTWKENKFLPFLCGITKKIQIGRIANERLKLTGNDANRIRSYKKRVREAKLLKEKLSFFTKNYLENLCTNLQNEKTFCSIYLTTNSWKKVLTGDLPKYKLYYLCKYIYPNKNIGLNELTSCAKKLTDIPKLCTKKSANKNLAFFPRPNCNRISDALSISHLKTDYQDCPVNADNLAITNIHRISMHFKKRTINSNINQCTNEMYASLENLYSVFDNDEKWPLKICYEDQIENEEICKNYIPGDSSKNAKSENNIVASIIKRIQPALSSLKCNLIDKDSYKPFLLRYKHGCFIVYEQANCTPLHCPKKVIYDTREITGIKYVGGPIFSYFQARLNDKMISLFKPMEQSLNFKNKLVRNLTELTTYLDSSLNSLIHGVGCLEDILPQSFKKISINQCTPMPFIIDGFIKKQDKILLSIRTSLDNLHAPRLISWNYIFSAILTYSKIQPNKQWALYGIK